MPRQIAIRISVDAIVVLIEFMFEGTDHCEIDLHKAITILLIYGKFLNSFDLRGAYTLSIIRRPLSSVLQPLDWRVIGWFAVWIRSITTK